MRMVRFPHDHVHQLGKEAALALHLFFGAEAALVVQFASALQQQVWRRRLDGMFLLLRGPERSYQEESDASSPGSDLYELALHRTQKKLNHLEIPTKYVVS